MARFIQLRCRDREDKPALLFEAISQTTVLTSDPLTREHAAKLASDLIEVYKLNVVVESVQKVTVY